VRILNELVDGQKLDRGDAEVLEVLDGGGMRQPGVGAAELLGHPLHQLREALHVQLVDDGLAERGVRALVVAPVELLRVDGDAEGDVAGAVGVAAALRATELVAEDGLRVVPRPGHGTGLRREQDLGGGEPEPVGRIPRSIDAEPVARSGGEVGDEPVEDVTRALGEHGLLLTAAVVEDRDDDLVGALAVDGDIRTAVAQGHPERVRRGGGRHRDDPCERRALGAVRR